MILNLFPDEILRLTKIFLRRDIGKASPSIFSATVLP